jgi:hypothetical protein
VSDLVPRLDEVQAVWHRRIAQLLQRTRCCPASAGNLRAHPHQTIPPQPWHRCLSKTPLSIDDSLSIIESLARNIPLKLLLL